MPLKFIYYTKHHWSIRWLLKLLGRDIWRRVESAKPPQEEQRVSSRKGD